jgi:hypothetical protein
MHPIFSCSRTQILIYLLCFYNLVKYLAFIPCLDIFLCYYILKPIIYYIIYFLHVSFLILNAFKKDIIILTYIYIYISILKNKMIHITQKTLPKIS